MNENVELLKQQETISKNVKSIVHVEIRFDWFKSKIYIEFLINKNPQYAFDLKNLNEKLPSKNYRIIQGILKVIEIAKDLFKKEPVMLNIYHSIKWLKNDVNDRNFYAFEYANKNNIFLNFKFQKK